MSSLGMLFSVDVTVYLMASTSLNLFQIGIVSKFVKSPRWKCSVNWRILEHQSAIRSHKLTNFLNSFWHALGIQPSSVPSTHLEYGHPVSLRHIRNMAVQCPFDTMELNRPKWLNHSKVHEPDNACSLYTCFSISWVFVAVLPSLRQNLTFVICSKSTST